MSAHRLSNDLKEMTDTDSLQIGNADQGDGVVISRGTTKPVDGTSGYLKGGLFINTDGSTVGTIVFINIGSNESCQFVPVNGIG